MRPADSNEILTVEETLRSAARACDPDELNKNVGELVRSFEDDWRPATATENLDEELRDAIDTVDPDWVDPAVPVTAATAHWLATNPADAEDQERAIREGSRLFFGEEAPEAVREWLVDRGIA